jgi:hypothetical protein
MRRDVRILLVGDGKAKKKHINIGNKLSLLEGVGKSTLIASLIKETFIPNVRSANKKRKEN